MFGPNSNTPFQSATKPFALGASNSTASPGFGSTTSFPMNKHLNQSATFGLGGGAFTINPAVPMAANSFGGAGTTGGLFSSANSNTNQLGNNQISSNTGFNKQSGFGGFGTTSSLGSQAQQSGFINFGSTTNQSPIAMNTGTFGAGIGSTFGSNAFGSQIQSPTQNVGSPFGNVVNNNSLLGTGSQTTSSNIFGGNVNPTQASGFGTNMLQPSGTANNAFNLTGSGAFSTSSNLFGQAQQPSSGGRGLFGANQNPPASLSSVGFFNTNTFNTNTNMSGIQPFNQTASFGQNSSTGFATNSFSVQGYSGTGNPPFRATQINETVRGSNTTLNLQVITGMQQYSSKSLEELRLEDYKLGNKAAQQSSGFGISGSSLSNNFPSNTPSSAVHSNTPLAGTPFGQQPAGGTIGSFGSFGSNNPVNQSTASTGFGFGQSTTSNSTPTTSFSFGSIAPTFTTTSTQPSFGFGNTTSTSPNKGPTFSINAQPSTTSASFAPPLNNPATPTTVGFGSTPGFGSTSLTPSKVPQFGSSIATPSLSFGSFASSNNGPSLATAPTGNNLSGFGGSAPSFSNAFGSTTALSQNTSSLNNFSSNYLGQNASTNNNQMLHSIQQFGNNQAFPMQQLNQSIPSVPVLSMDNKLDLLEKKKGELQKPGDRDRLATDAIDSPRMFAGFNAGIKNQLVRHTSIRIGLLPRGHHKKILEQSSPESKTLIQPAIFNAMRNVVVAQELVAPSFKGAKGLVVSSQSPHILTPVATVDYSFAETPVNRKGERSLDGNIIEDATGLTPIGVQSPKIRHAQLNSENRNRLDEKCDLQGENSDNTGSIINFGTFSPPNLQKQGYYTNPDISLLRKMNARELSMVPNFVIFRPNVGKIAWESFVDLRDIDLDTVVCIEHREVTVYESDPPPPFGSGLNKPAIITLYNVYPKSHDVAPHFLNKLKSFCLHNEADFLSYDEHLGEWIFAVKHFSRYGLDEEDEGVEVCVAATDSRTSLSFDNEVLKQNLSATSSGPFLLENVRNLRKLFLPLKTDNSDDVKMGRHVLHRDSDFRGGETRYIGYDKVQRKEGGTEHTDTNIQYSLSKALAGNVRAIYHPRESFAFTTSMETQTARLPAQSTAVSSVISGPSNPVQEATMSSKKTRVFNMDKSFRVGWSQNGLIVVASFATGIASDKAHRVVIKHISPNLHGTERSNQQNLNHYIMNAARLALSRKCDIEGLEFYYWSGIDVKGALAKFLQNLGATFDQKFSGKFECQSDRCVAQICSLFRSIYCQETLMSDIGPRNKHYSVQERRQRNQFSMWLEGVVTAEDNETEQKGVNYVQTLFDLVSSHQINAACECAQRNRQFRLACLISQLDSDSSFNVLLSMQSHLWYEQGAEELFSEETKSLYRLISLNKSSIDQSLLRGLGWLKSFACLFWYFIDVNEMRNLSIFEALRLFDSYLVDQLVESPRQALFCSYSRDGSNIPHAFYNLLHVIACEGNRLDNAWILNSLMTEAYSPDQLDFRAAYLVLLFFEALEISSPTLDHSKLLRIQFIEQLIVGKDFECASFIALQLESDLDRKYMIKSILSSWIAHSYDPQTQLLANMPAFYDLHIPIAYFHEAAAAFMGHCGLYEQQLSHLLAARRGCEALDVIAEKIAPHCNLRELDGQKLVIGLIESCEAVCGVTLEKSRGLIRIIWWWLHINFIMEGERPNKILGYKKSFEDLLRALISYQQVWHKGKVQRDASLTIMLKNITSHVLRSLYTMESMTVTPSSSSSMSFLCEDASIRSSAFDDVKAEAWMNGISSFLDWAADGLVL